MAINVYIWIGSVLLGLANIYLLITKDREKEILKINAIFGWLASIMFVSSAYFGG